MKFQTKNKLSAYLLGLLIGTGIALPINVTAAPGNLADEPLFLTNKAEPNIFFMTDDSGSMDADLMTPLSNPPLGCSSGCEGLFYISYPGGGYNWYGYVTKPTTNDNRYTDLVVPTQASLQAIAGAPASYYNTVWRVRNSSYNKVYYDPTVTYKPWSGLDNAGAIYQDAYDPTGPTWRTRLDPYISTSTVVDLTASQSITTSRPNISSTGASALTFSYTPDFYWVWKDDGDTIIEEDDLHVLIDISSAPTCSGALGLKTSVDTQYTEQCILRTSADELVNFANWWTYHRRREYAAKNALSDVVKNSNGVRMGIATINENNSANTLNAMASMNPDVSTGNKRSLLNSIFSIQSEDGTGLLTALEESGNYYDGVGATPFGNNQLALDTTAPTGASTAPDQCSQNFTILMTDGYYTGTESGYDHADNDSSNWTGSYDPENDGTTVSNTFSFDGNPYADSYQETLADIAMHYYERDLRTATPNKVPIRCGLDENPGQHMVTYTVAFGVNGTIDPATLPAHPNRGYATSCSATTGSAFTWPDPATATGKIDELIHAAYNGRGEYLNAANPTELSTRLTDAFRSITSRIGAASGVTFNTNVLNSNSKLYRARFNSTQWSGELEAIALDAFGNLATTIDWEAGNVLSTRNITTNERIMVTYKPSTNAAVAFRWANLDTSQQDDLKTDSTGTAEVTALFPRANARLAFIRGDRTCEIGAVGTCSITKEFRARSSRLGDLIHSQPIYSGVPSQRWPVQAPFGAALETYSDYKNGVAAASDAFSSTKVANTRTPMLYIGGNDGMLHAFNADNGEEVYSYIPSMVYSNTTGYGLHALSEPGYNHKYYVDLSPTVSEAYIDTGSGDNWHTVLVGGLRGGGRGLFALNVTDPDAVIEAGTTTAKETAVKNQVMWEFTNADDADMGYSFSQLSIVPLGTSSGVEWYVVFGNGYNADTSAGADGESKLFLLKLEGPGVDNTWNLGTDYYKITTGVGTTADINGLSTPRLLDLNSDSIADRAYAGDLHGRMWAFDLTGSSGWDVAYDTSGTPKPLFTASTGDAGAGIRQPITDRPVIIRHPTVHIALGSNEPNLMIYFGTGQYLAAGDLSDTTTQSFYAVWDQGDQERTVHRTDPTDAANHLVKKVFTTPQALTREGGTEAVDYTTDYGWYYDLPDTGERVTTNPSVYGDIVFFNTLIPSLEPCGYGGSGWELGVSTTDGSSSCGTFDTNGDGALDCVDDISSAGSKKIGSVPMESNFIGGGGGGYTAPPVPTLPAGCPAYVEPALQSCPAGQKLVTTYPLDGSSCPIKTNACKPICEEGKTPVTRWTTNSDGTQSKATICIDSNTAHTGRFSWRELPI